MSFMKLFEDFLQKKDADNSVPSAPLENDKTLPEPSISPSPSPAPSVVNSIENTVVAANASSASVKNKMEHSYTTRPSVENPSGLQPARKIVIRRGAQCTSCHLHPLDEHEMDEGHKAAIPTYNDVLAKEAMNECARIARYVKNNNPDDEDWEAKICQYTWTLHQKVIFGKVAAILNDDYLVRLANTGRSNEPMLRRLSVDKSASRMRKVFASANWDEKLTHWLHGLLMEKLPSTYMAGYLDILQTLKSKVPTLMDKMLFGRPLNISQELLAPVMKKRWEPVFSVNPQQLPPNAVIVAMPAIPLNDVPPPRIQRWYQQIATITEIVHVSLPSALGLMKRQPIDQIAEQLVSLTRVKIQELRNENAARSIILIGFNAGASLALQVAMSENLSCVICMGFAYNTTDGVRGNPDDRILEIKSPILFVVGQKSARTSVEEIEGLRERMQSETTLVVVGCADDELKVSKSHCKVENVTQSMVDAMIIDEIFEFIKKILANPPGARVPTVFKSSDGSVVTMNGKTVGGAQQRKRKHEPVLDADGVPIKAHIGRPRTRPLPGTIPTTTVQTAVKSTPQTVTVGQVGLGNGTVKQILPQLSPSSAKNTEELNTSLHTLLTEPMNESTEALTLSNAGSLQNTTTITKYTAAPSQANVKANIFPAAQQKPLTTIHTASGQKIKMIPTNSGQYIQIRPPMQAQSKVYTFKTSPMTKATTGDNVGNIASTSTTIVSNVPPPTPTPQSAGQQQIFTLKSPNGKMTQFVTAASAGAPQKYTLVRNAAGGATLQLNPTISVSSVKKVQPPPQQSKVDIANIIDMPILFADNDGNISDTVVANEAAKAIATGVNSGATTTTIKPNTSSSVGQLIISQKIIKEAPGTTTAGVNSSATLATSTNSATKPGGTYLINNKPHTAMLQPSQTSNKKVVFLNRNTMRPCTNLIGNPATVSSTVTTPGGVKLTKVFVTNPKTSETTLVQRPLTQIVTTATAGSSAVKQLNLKTIKSDSTVVSSLNPTTVAKPMQRFQIIKQGGILPTTSQLTNTNSGDNRNLIRNIMVKPSALRQVPNNLKTQLLNRNLTVRKLVNIVPVPKPIGQVNEVGNNNNTNRRIVLKTITPTIEVSSSSEDDPTQRDDAVREMSFEALNDLPQGTTVIATQSRQTAPKVITLNPINPTIIKES